MLQKVAKSGPEWEQVILLPEGTGGAFIGAADRNGVLLWMENRGQLSGHPAETRGSPVIARYSANGTQVLIKQDPEYSAFTTSSALGLAADGGFYLALPDNGTFPTTHEDFVPTYVKKFDDQGRLQWKAPIWLKRPLGDMRGGGGSPSFVKEVSGGLLVGIRGISRLPSGSTLTRLDRSGNQQWTKHLVFSHEEVIDEIEGTTETGTADNADVVVTEDAIYLASEYEVEYEFGSTPREPYDTVLVHACTLDNCDPLWTKRYRFNPANEVIEGGKSMRTGTAKRAVSARLSGNKVGVAAAYMGTPRGLRSLGAAGLLVVDKGQRRQPEHSRLTGVAVQRLCSPMRGCARSSRAT